MMMMIIFYTTVSSTARKKNPWHACPMLHGERSLLAHDYLVRPCIFTRKKVITSQEQKEKKTLTGPQLAELSELSLPYFSKLSCSYRPVLF
jgi:hypothetical protein